MPKTTGKVGKVTHDVLQRYKFVRAVYRTYYTTLDVPVQDLATEFFYVVGDILEEGKLPDESRLRHLDLEQVRRVLKEG
jgi:hypothetical protein